jgi:hypothetical protein
MDKNLLIGLPSWTGIHWYCTMSLFILATNLEKLGLKSATLMMIPRRNTVDARQIIYDKFKDSPEFTHLLSLDDDLGFNVSDVRKLFDADKPFISGMYKWRRMPARVTAHKNGKCLLYDNVKNKGIIEVDSCSLGFALLKRSAIIGNYTFWRSPKAEQDINFVTALKKKKVKLYYHTDVLLTHASEALIGEDIKIV